MLLKLEVEKKEIIQEIKKTGIKSPIDKDKYIIILNNLFSFASVYSRYGINN